MTNNNTLQEQNFRFHDCPTHTNKYEVDGQKFTVISHFIGDRNINDVMYDYAMNRAMNEMLGRVPSGA